MSSRQPDGVRLAPRAPAQLLWPLGRAGWLVLVGLLVGLGLAVARAGAVAALVGPAVLGGVLLVLLVRAQTVPEDGPEEARRVFRWTAAAFVVHLSASLVITNASFLLEYLGPDALTYHDLARDIVNHWNNDFPFPHLPSGKEGFYYLLAGIYWVFGAHTAAGLAVNATLAAAIVPLATDTTRRLFGPRAARYAAPLTLLTPGVLLWTSQLLKEAPILFLLALAANCAVRLSDRIAVAPVCVLAGTMAVLFSFRGWVGVMAAGGFLIGIAFSRRQLIGGFGAGVTALGMISLLVILTGLGYSGYQTAVSSDLQQASEIRRDLAVSASSGFDSDADISTPAQALTYLPRAMVTFILGPFPWQIRGGRQLPVIPDLLVWWALLPSLWRGLKAAGRHRGRQILVLVMPALTTSVLLALAVGNFGTLLRERTQVFILLVPFICVGLSLRGAEPAGGEDTPDTPVVDPAADRMTRWP